MMAGENSVEKTVEKLAQAKKLLTDEIGKVIIGQKTIIDHLLITILCRGHALMVGVPGLAKTLIVRTIAQVLDLKFSRIQFTPDLMPSDITGTDIIEEDPATGHRRLEFIKGPIFANIILADEINRTPPKTQAALLQVMQEYQVTVGNKTFNMDLPFFVIATQNPIEQEGVYPLPEAQLDRFMFNLRISYPSYKEEVLVVKNTTSTYEPHLDKVLAGEEIRTLQDLVRKVPVSDEVVEYAVKLASMSRPETDGAPDFIKQWVNWGASPRASQYLILGAKALALLKGNFSVSFNDVRAVAEPVLYHRIITNFHARSEEIEVQDIIAKLISSIDGSSK
jgi:MoxR-like ATPase